MINPLEPDYQNTPVSPQRPHFNYAPENREGQPYLSIVTPFYNTGVLFHETARSVLNQSFQQWEWLIINDGSTDPEALAVLDTYRGCDPRIRVIDRESNGGPGAARNTGFQAAATPYILQLDSDNLLEPAAAETWLWHLMSFLEYGFVKGYTVGFGAEEYLWTSGFHAGPDFLYKNNVDATALVRKEVHSAVGGYDEGIRAGFEDWEFWLRCASCGFWGSTIPQFQDWYRRRPSHSDRWEDWDEGARQQRFLSRLRRQYPALWERGFPRVEPQPIRAHELVPEELPFENRLIKDRPRLLLILPWLTMGGADRFNLNLIKQLTGRGWEVTIATTLEGDHSWLSEFSAYTPDIFILHHFLNLADTPRFLRYLACSRQVDCILISHSELAYQLLPYLRAHLPGTALVDYCHMEEEAWKNGGYPRMSLQYQEALDLQIVSSQHLKTWMAAHGGAEERLRVCYTNIDSSSHGPGASSRDPSKETGLPPLMVYAGRICAQKRPQVFARTLLRLAGQGLPFRVAVAGDGPDREWLAAFIRQHRLGRQVRLLGTLSSRQMLKLLGEADIFFLPSQWEGISLAIYEAMAAGLAIVAADVGGQRELVTPECGILIKPGSEETEIQAYAEALAGLLKDPARARQLGAKGRERISGSFRLDQMGARMVELFEEAMDFQRSNPRPQPSPGLARAIATQAVEYLRLSRLADQLWMMRHGHLDALDRNARSSLRKLDWRQRAYLKLYQWHEPVYHWYTRRGWTWMNPVRERVKQVFLRPSRS